MALNLKKNIFSKNHDSIVSFGVSDGESGEGLHYKGEKYIHHSKLHHFETALYNLVSGQKIFLLVTALLLVGAFILSWHTTLIVIFSTLTVLYFLDLLFSAFVVWRSLKTKPEIHVSEEEILKLKHEDLPVYTIFCPLYKEWQVAPQFIEAMQALDYPKEKLQILLLLEENDKQTIEKIGEINLPENFEVVIVPNSKPKTKPKAMNYGLKFARGEKLVIYDAEDKPEPDQLKKAVVAFKRSDEKVICIQAKLNFYNPNQNILTKIFTAEYSLWFDLVLPGLQSIYAPIPLGGTSNHFKINILRELAGWDAFNVTEDCDLGMRLAKKGYRTAVVESTTHEEANSGFYNWYTQRSRWIKGYIQTYMVHMRKPGSYLRSGKLSNFFIFQIIIGGKAISLFTNPIMWAITVSYFLWRPITAPFIETLFPGIILYIGVFSLVFGNFLYLYYYMIGCAKRGHDSLIKYVFLIPIYWFGMSIAAWKAAYEIIVKPHYWAKTVHGLHLAGKTKKEEKLLPEEFQKVPVAAFKMAEVFDAGLSDYSNSSTQIKLAPEAVVTEKNHPDATPDFVNTNNEIRNTASVLNFEEIEDVSPIINESSDPLREKKSKIRNLKDMFKGWTDSLASQAGMLVAASVLANFINFVFNAYLGRNLSLSDYGIVAMMSTFAYLLNIFINALSNSITHTVSFLEGKMSGNGIAFFKNKWLSVILTGFLAGILWFLAVPFISAFFNVSGSLIIVSFAPAIILGALDSYNRGLLKGIWNFKSMAAIVIIEVLVKLGAAVGFVISGFSEFAAISIPLSVVFSAIVSSIFCISYYFRKKGSEVGVSKSNFPYAFYMASLVSGLSVSAFLSFDVILAKHFLSPDDAGRYGLLSLIGKMIFFFGSLLNMFIITFVSRDIGKKKDPIVVFTKIFTATLGLTVFSALTLSIFRDPIVPMLLGEKAKDILAFIPLYSVAIALFTISSTIVLYHLARKKYVFPALSFLMSVLMITAVNFYHGSIGEFVDVVFLVNIVFFLLISLLHLFYRGVVYVCKNALDILSVFRIMPAAPLHKDGKKRILIFNWRDIENKFAGGAENYIHSMARDWSKDGHAVTLFCGNDGTQRPNAYIDGIRVIRRGGFYGVYVAAFFYYFFQFRGHFDFIIDCENGIPFFTPLYAKEKVYCLIHHIHQEVFRKYLPLPLAVFAAFLERKLMPLVFRNSSFITVSESSKKDIKRLRITNREITVINPGIDMEALRPGKKSSYPVISYVGRLREYKSIDILIRAFSKINLLYPNARLIIGGDGDDKKRLMSLAEDLQMSHVISFPGKISEEEKLKIFQESWVFVNPSMVEGWGITTIEASACATPIIASDVPGLRDSVKDGVTGSLVPYGDVGALADKIVEFISDGEMRELFSKNALTWSFNFSWQKSSKLFIEAVLNDFGHPKKVQTFVGAMKLRVFIYLRRLIYKILGFIGKITSQVEKGVVVLCYHSVAEDTWRFSVDLAILKLQIEHLMKLRKPVSIEELSDHVKGIKIIREPAFLVAFDDGYRDLLKTKSYFKSKNIKPVVFALSDIDNADRNELETDRPLLSTSELKELKNDGWGIGCHSATHPNFNVLPTHALREEIIRAKFNMENTLGFPIKYFAYPKGRYSPIVTGVVRDAGYDLAFSMDDGYADVGTDPAIIPRIGVDRTHTFEEFVALASPWLIQLRSRIKMLARKINYQN